MDFKSRFQNKTFVTTFLTSLVGTVYLFLGIFDVTSPISENEFINLIGIFIGMLSNLGILINPTTPGVGD